MKKHYKAVVTALFWFAVIAATVCLFRAGQAAAIAERGHAALGGEYVLLTFPIWVLAERNVIRDLPYLMVGKDRHHEN